MAKEINFTIENLVEMAKDETFFSGEYLEITQKELILFGANFSDVGILDRYISDNSIYELNRAHEVYLDYKETKTEKSAPDNLSGNFAGFGAQRFCALVCMLADMRNEIYNNILPLAQNLEIKSLDLDGIETVGENIGSFLDGLEVSYRDKRF